MKELIIITGGSGLVGHGIKHNQHQYKNYEFLYLNSKILDLKNYEKTLNYFQEKKPTYVIHLAANVGGLFKNMNQKVQMFEDNLLINQNVVKASYKTGVKKLIGCLSTCIFPDKVTYPIQEAMLHNGPPHESNDAYAYSKRMLDVLIKSYQQQYNKDFICVIPTNIYGKYDNFHLEDSHVIPGLIHKCYIAKKNNEKFIVSGSGKPLRQFIYSNDLGNLILKILFEYHEKDSIILSPNEKDEVSIEQIAKLIAEKFDYLEQLEFDISKSDGQYKKTVDNSKLMNFCNDFKFTELEDGLNNTIEWFINNYDNNIIRK